MRRSLHLGFCAPWLYFILVTAGFAPAAAGQTVIHRLRAGGPALTDSQGQLWSADHSFNTGSPFSTGSSIANTPDAALYQTERWDAGTAPELRYELPVPAAGAYRVRLHFADICTCTHRMGARVFDVKAEGQTVLANLDIFAEAGPFTALVKTVDVPVSDGALTLELIHKVENPKISAIEVLRLETTAPATAPTPVPPPTTGRTYEVGPGKPLATIGAVPWQSLEPGDQVLIHYRPTPYQEKWVIGRQGTAAAPIVVRGVPDASGRRPVIDGNNARTAPGLNYWNEDRGVIKIGGSNVPANTMPRDIVIENLEIANGRDAYSFTADDGARLPYTRNAAAIFIEKGENITIRNCVIRDSGNGIFATSTEAELTRNLRLEGNFVHNNGNPYSAYEHNIYTQVLGLTLEGNRFGPLVANSDGHNIKDRSAGVVIRYNWIEGGNRQLDLVDTVNVSAIRYDPSYRDAYVYGNVFREPGNDGGRNIVHFGGDSGNTAAYRGGTLFFFQNTVVSLRTDRNTLFRLSTNNEKADIRNNILYTTLNGASTSIFDNTGQVTLYANWAKTGWVKCFCTPSGVLTEAAAMITGAGPGFTNEGAQDYRPAGNSLVVNRSMPQAAATLPQHDTTREYLPHQRTAGRRSDGARDLGALEANP